MFDSTRVMNRLKCIFRSKGISTGNREIYSIANKEERQDKLPLKIRPQAGTYYFQLAMLYRRHLFEAQENLCFFEGQSRDLLQWPDADAVYFAATHLGKRLLQ